MKTAFRVKLADLELENLDNAPAGSGEFRQKVMEALEHEYRAFARLGKVEITLEGDWATVELTTDDGVNPVGVAVSEVKAGRVSEGVSLLRFLHACAPDDPQVLFLLGSCLSDAGDLERAEAYLHRAVELNPSFVDALINLGVVLCRMKKLDSAAEILSKAVQLDPANPYAHRNLGACIASSGQDFARAQNHLERAVELAPTDQQAWLALGRLYQTQGKTDAARTACMRVLEISKESPYAEYARMLLSQL